MLETALRMIFAYAKLPPERVADIIKEAYGYMRETVDNIRALKRHTESTDARLARIEKHLGIKTAEVVAIEGGKIAQADNG